MQSKNATEQLESCPFDGENSAHIQREGSACFVRCMFCGVTTRLFTDEAEAIAAWNRRAGRKNNA